jgi:hypothetical protein
MGEVLLDAEIRTHLGYVFLHDSDDRGGVIPEDDDHDPLVIETTDGVCLALGDQSASGESPVRVRVVRGPGDGPGQLVFEETLFLYGAGLVLEDGFPSRRHVLDLGGPGRVGVLIFLDRKADPDQVTVVLGDLLPDRSVLPPVPLTRRVAGWFRSGR